MKIDKDIKKIYAKSRKEWRRWLEKNHKKESNINLIKYKKHTGKPFLTSKEAMEEAICFGWIDTTIKRLDEERYMQRFVKRKKNANWSRNTLSYARELIKQGKMSEQGLSAYKLGLKKKPHDYNRTKNPKIPEDLKKELEKVKNKKTKENFKKIAPSYKRRYLWWIETAKRRETREKRIKEFIERIKLGKKFGEA